jgi:hypothetical protein
MRTALSTAVFNPPPNFSSDSLFWSVTGLGLGLGLVYDPAGDIYEDGPQYGCIQPSFKLLFRFLILVSHRVRVRVNNQSQY